MIAHDTKLLENYIACDMHTRSEIVVPCMRNGAIATILDIDSPTVGTFSEVDKENLEDLVYMIYDRPATPSNFMD